MKKIYNIENEEKYFRTYCVDREIRPITITIYKYALQKYSDFTGKTLYELIEESEDEEEAGIRLIRRTINKYLRGFKIYLKNERWLHNKSINLNLLLVKSFYRQYGIEVPKNTRKGVDRKYDHDSIDDLLTFEEIRGFMEHMNSAYRSLVVMCISSGMSDSDVTSLTFEQLYKGCGFNSYPKTIPELIEQLKAKGNFIPTWNLIRVKVNIPYTTFSSPESVERIIIYLEYLNHKIPEYKPELDHKLFRSLKTNNALLANDFISLFGYINRKFDFRKTKDGRNVLRTHTLRKKFATTLEINKVPFLTIERLLCHKIDSTISAYYKPSIESLKEDYMKVVNELITTNQEVIILNPYENIQQEVDSLKKFIIESGKFPEEYRDLILHDQARMNYEMEKEDIERVKSNVSTVL